MSVDAATIGRPEERPIRTSELLCEFAASLSTPQVSVRQIVDALGDRGLGVLIAIFALPNILPSVVPFGNVLFGLMVMIFGVHLMLGVRHLVLPDFVGRRAMSARTFKAWAPRLARALSWFERLLKPSLPAVTHAGPERLIGAVTVILALVCSLPIPLAHNIPAFALTLIGLGMIERDGRAILSGTAIGALGVVLLGLVLFGLASGFEYLARWA
jgi:hypothetical protein